MEMTETLVLELEPSYRDLAMHHIVHYRAHLAAGTFVVLNDEPGVWRIVKFVDGFVVVNQFVTVSSAPQSIRPSIRRNNEVSTRHIMTEVIQTSNLRNIEPLRLQRKRSE
eukprot:scaffold160025_cov59-Attheya_sp.AAC.1